MKHKLINEVTNTFKNVLLGQVVKVYNNTMVIRTYASDNTPITFVVPSPNTTVTSLELDKENDFLTNLGIIREKLEVYMPYPLASIVVYVNGTDYGTDLYVYIYKEHKFTYVTNIIVSYATQKVV